MKQRMIQALTEVLNPRRIPIRSSVMSFIDVDHNLSDVRPLPHEAVEYRVDMRVGFSGVCRVDDLPEVRKEGVHRMAYALMGDLQEITKELRSVVYELRAQLDSPEVDAALRLAAKLDTLVHARDWQEVG